jgi:hypothetical protein
MPYFIYRPVINSYNFNVKECFVLIIQQYKQAAQVIKNIILVSSLRI